MPKLSPPTPKKSSMDRVKANRATVCGPSSTEKSVSVRKIENGYIVSESTYGPKGYKSTERFTQKPPVIEIEPTRSRK